MMLLKKRKVWGVVSGDDAKPLGSPNSKAVKGWTARDEEVLATIVGAINASQFHLTQGAASAKEVWDNIVGFHRTQGMGSIVATWRELFRTKQAPKGAGMRDLIGCIQDMVSKLTSLGETVSDHQIIAIIIEALPTSYESLAVALDSHPDHNKLDYVISHILNEETQKHSEPESHSDTSHHMDGSVAALSACAIPDCQKVKCHKCNVLGHFKNECGTFPFDLVPVNHAHIWQIVEEQKTEEQKAMGAFLFDVDDVPESTHTFVL